MDIPDIPTPLPKSAVESISRAVRDETVVDLVWRAFVVVLFILLIWAIASANVLGFLIGGILLGALLREDVRAFVADVWNRNFWVWRT